MLSAAGIIHMLDSIKPKSTNEIIKSVIAYNDMYEDNPWDITKIPLQILAALEVGCIAVKEIK